LGPEEYIKRGWKIFPCHAVIRGKCTCGKPDCKNPGKHPRTRNGHTDASSDLQTIRTWWTTWPDANIAVSTGAVSGIWAVDVDPRHGGFDSLNDFEENRPEGTLPETLRSVTGGSGRHIIFKYPSDGSRVPTRNPWRPGIEVKSDGGYIILPPGTHISGGRYQWINWDTQEPVSAPRDLLESIRDTPTNQSGREALPDAASILDGVPEGKRDDTLFRWACRLRRQLGDDSYRAVETLVLTAARNSDPPFPDEDARRKVDQAFKQDHSDDVTEWGYLTDEGEKLEHLTDVGNKNRLIAAFGEEIRFVPQWGWMEWTDTGWYGSGSHVIMSRAERVPELIRLEAINKITDSIALKKWTKHSFNTESAGSLSAIARLAEYDPRVLRQAKEFDSNLYEIACMNGIVDLRTGQIRSFERDDLVTKNTNVVYDPQFFSEEWETFLKVCTQGDAEMIRYLQMAAGYTLTGDIREEAFFVLSGPTASGKSTFLDALLGILGSYGTTTQSDTFMYRRGKDTAPHELASFVGKRIVGMSEIREGEGFSEAVIKQVTGGDTIKAKMLYKDPFDYVPQFKLWIATNHDPASHDAALMRRIKRIMFNHTIPEHQRNAGLKSWLKSPDHGGKAVLAWAVRGAMEFLRVGKLPEPDKVKLAVHTYAEKNDTFTRFVNDCFFRDKEGVVHGRSAYRTYSVWCGTVNERPVKMQQFEQRMKDRGIEQLADGSYTGIAERPMIVSGAGVSWS
jgi:putative DNA primase/helicase